MRKNYLDGGGIQDLSARLNGVHQFNDCFDRHDIHAFLHEIMQSTIDPKIHLAFFDVIVHVESIPTFSDSRRVFGTGDLFAMETGNSRARTTHKKVPRK